MIPIIPSLRFLLGNFVEVHCGSIDASPSNQEEQRRHINHQQGSFFCCAHFLFIMIGSFAYFVPQNQCDSIRK